MIERILVPLDGSALAERALPFAVRLASAAGAHLFLMHGQPRLPTGQGTRFDLTALAARLREGEAVGAISTPTRVEVDAVVREVYLDRVAEGICETAADLQADLIVMSTHGRGGIGRWLYGSVADQVLRRSAMPVLLISATCDPRWPDRRSRRILVPLDGSAFAEAAIRPACDLATTLHADLILVGAAGPLEYGSAEGIPYVRSGFEAALAEVRAYLESVAERLRAADQSVEVVVDVGRAGPIVDAVARELNVDLIAMATHGRSGIARLALGSVATEILQRATVPLLLTRPAGVRRLAATSSTPERTRTIR